MTQTQTATETNDYADIKQRLAVRVPQELIRTRNQGGRDIDYINVNDYKDLLDARAGIWEAQITDTRQVGDSICVTLRLFIHANDGVYAMDGSGMEPLNGSGYGDPYSNAYAQAFRRACECHGLSRELWRKDDHGHANSNGGVGPGFKQTLQQLRAEVQNSPAYPNNPQAPRSFAPATKPANGKAEGEAERITIKQLSLLAIKAKEYGTDAETVVHKAFPGLLPDEISKKAAGWIIDSLIKRIEEQA